jgi:hypothetical protein
MKRLIFALSGILLLTSFGWGEQLSPGEQAHASVAGHRQEAKDNERRHHHRRHRGHRRHRRQAA